MDRGSTEGVLPSELEPETRLGVSKAGSASKGCLLLRGNGDVALPLPGGFGVLTLRFANVSAILSSSVEGKS